MHVGVIVVVSFDVAAVNLALRKVIWWTAQMDNRNGQQTNTDADTHSHTQSTNTHTRRANTHTLAQLALRKKDENNSSLFFCLGIVNVFNALLCIEYGGRERRGRTGLGAGAVYLKPNGRQRE